MIRQILNERFYFSQRSHLRPIPVFLIFHFLKMTRVRDFFVNLAIGGHSASEIEAEVAKTFQSKAMSLPQIYKIIRDVKAGRGMGDQRAGNAVKTVRTVDMIEAVREFVTSDRRVTFSDIEEEFGLSRGTMANIMKDDLGLVKKSARWVPRLLSPDQMKIRMENSRFFLSACGYQGGLLTDLSDHGRDSCGLLHSRNPGTVSTMAT